MAEVSIAIVGLGRIGASVGLALKRYNRQKTDNSFKISGYDTNPGNVKTAQSMGAVDQVSNRLEEVTRNKDIVVIAMPYGEVKVVFETIAHVLRPGAVILDMSALKMPSLEWAKKDLPEEVHLVCATPIANPKYLFEGTDQTARASEDYFDKGVLMLMPSINCIGEAITLSSDFATVIGSKPHFFDPAEHDALMAGTEALPSLLGTVYFQMLSRNAGWGDMQRLMNPSAGMLSRHLFDTHPDDLRDFWMDSNADLTRYLDEMIARLQDFRQAVASKDRHALESALEKASKDYETWVNRRHNNRWQDDDMMNSDTPTFGNVVGNMFGSFVTNRFRRQEKDD